MHPPAGTPFVAPLASVAPRVRESFARQGAMRHIGAELLAIDPGYCAIALPARVALMQQTLMVMHGKGDAPDRRTMS